MCHSYVNDWVNPGQQLQTSVDTDKAWWSLLSGTPIFFGKNTPLMVAQTKNVIRTKP